MDKKTVNKLLSQIPGTKWYNMSSNRPMPTGMKGFPDHFGFDMRNNRIYFIEDKFGRDKLSEEQAAFFDMLESAIENNAEIRYLINTDSKVTDNIKLIAEGG